VAVAAKTLRVEGVSECLVQSVHGTRSVPERTAGRTGEPAC
jgi:hypothetical protein